MNKSKINCPRCGEEIDVNDILYHRVEAQLRQKYQGEFAQEKQKYTTEALKLKEDRNRLDTEKRQLEEKITQQVQGRVRQREMALTETIKAAAAKEQADTMSAMRKELDEKSDKITQLNHTAIALEKIKREKDELEAAIKAKTEQALSRKLTEERIKIQGEFAQEKQKYTTEALKLKEDRNRLDTEKRQLEEKITQQVQGQVQQKEMALTEKIKAAAAKEQADAMSAMRKELDEKSDKITQLNHTTIALETIKREKDELEAAITAKTEQALSRKLTEERIKIQKEANEKSELRLKELEQQLEMQKKLTAEMQQKQTQGSIQIQGEAQELAIEAWLAEKFPLDTIQEIKKGERGADCLQIVHTRTRQNCGAIYYESKRAKAFQAGWIEKFKADIREKNADIGVLVTAAMPDGMVRLGLKDGVWVCSFDEFKGLCVVLRESLIQISTAIVAQENKGDKMGLLYDFLTSNEFKLQIEAIVAGFTQMKVDLEAEQRAMRGIWKKREKQIDKVVLNTVNMHGSIKGIAGNAIQTVPLLELPPDDA